MSTDLTSAFEGLDPSVMEAISRPEVLERISAYVESAKTPLVANKNEVLGKYNAMKKDIEALGGFDAIKSLAQQAAEARAKADAAALQSGDVEAVRKQAQSEIEKYKSRVSSLEQSMLNEQVSNKLIKAIRDEKGIPELLEPHIRSRIQTALDENGKASIKVLNADGSEMMVDGVKPASIKDLLVDMKRHATFARAFDADAKGGSGAKGGDPITANVANPWLTATRSYSEQNRIARQDPTLAKALAAAAGKTINL